MKPLLLVLLVLLFVVVGAAGRARNGLVVRVDVRFLDLDVLAAAEAARRTVVRNIKCSILGIVVECAERASEVEKTHTHHSTLMGLEFHDPHDPTVSE